MATSGFVPQQPLPEVGFAILDPTTQNQVFDYDTFVDFSVQSRMKVSEFPVEQGAFATYNKVQEPFKVKITLAVSDTPERRHAFLMALEEARLSTQRMDILLPEGTYLNATLEGYSSTRKQVGGWGMVVATLNFVQVREVRAAYTNVKVAGGNSSKNGGQQTSLVNPYDNDLSGQAGVDLVDRTATVLGGGKDPSAIATVKKNLSKTVSSVASPAASSPQTAPSLPSFQ